MEPKRHSARVLFRTRRHTYGCPNQRFGRNMQLAVRLLLHRTHTLLMRPHWSVRSSAPVLVSALAASWLYLTKTGVPIGRVHVGGRIREGLSLFPSVFSTGLRMFATYVILNLFSIISWARPPRWPSLSVTVTVPRFGLEDDHGFWTQSAYHISLPPQVWVSSDSRTFISDILNTCTKTLSS